MTRLKTPLFAAASLSLLCVVGAGLLLSKPMAPAASGLRGKLSIEDLAPSVSSAEAQEAIHMPSPNYPSLKSLGISLKRTLPEDYLSKPNPRPLIVPVGRGLQCAQYARMRSGLAISGNASAWWSLAAAKYRRDKSPALGAVMVMGGTRHGHVAVVVEIRSSREVLIDHANWMNRGEIQMGALVRDISENNDWSVVRVWYPPINDLGNRPYPVIGFILNEPLHPPAQDLAPIPTAAQTDAATAPQPASM
jgi:CHAP domain